MPDIVHGEDGVISVEIDNEFIPVACFEDFTYTFLNELILKTDANAGLARKRRVRISDGNLSITGATTLDSGVSNVSAFYFLQEGVRRSELTMQLAYTDEGGVLRYITGVFLIESIKLSNPVNDIDGYDIEMVGTSIPSISEIASPDSPVCFESMSDWWTPSAAATSFSGAGYAGRSFAGHNIIEVVREANPALIYTAGTPGEREYSFNGTTIGTWASNPFDGIERVFVLWQEEI